MGRKSDVSLDRFFAELASRLDTTRRVEREFDRKLAHRFNVFNYLREDELGLSRVIADLLDPEKKHGQGELFLRTLLDLAGLSGTPDWPDVDGNGVCIAVKSEHSIRRAGRRIDILVRIRRAGEKAYGLAIENKPYAGDQKNQVQDYLKYLKQEYGERFLLIYVSPNGEAPSEESLPRRTLGEWKDRFAIMPYHEAHVRPAKDFDDFRLGGSLVDWLEACRKNCEAERLRWFLEDFKVLCGEIGGHTVTDHEKETAVRFVLDNLQTAQVVYESWSVVVDRVCEKFLETMCDRIKTEVEGRAALKAFAHDTCICYRYSPKAFESTVWLYRKHWNEYPEDHPTDRERKMRTCIRLQNLGRGPSGWIVGVSSPVDLQKSPGDYKKRWQRLEKELKDAFRESTGKSSDWWPWYEDVKRDWSDWRQLVPDLHREWKEPDGEIMTYFVDKFIDIAERAIPVINDIEV